MKRLTHILFLATLGLSLYSCNSFTDGYDVNPNVSPDAPSDQQLTATQVAEGFVLSGEMARQAGIWTDYFTGEDRQYNGLQNYTTAAGDYDNMWSNSYRLTLTNARLIEEKASAVQNFQLLGIAQVLEAQMIGTVTSLWGNVPYSEAFITDKPGKYDEQSAVYAAVQALLTQAIDNLGKNGVNPKDRDIYYKGDVVKWQAAAHSLKARYYLHIKNYPQAIVEARLGIRLGGDMLMPYGGTVGASANPYYDFLDNSRTGYMSAQGAYAVGLLGDTGPLSRTNAKTNETGRFAYFYDDRQTNSNYFDVDPNFVDGAFAADASFPLVSYVETQLILAEGLVRTNDLSGALSALNAVRVYNTTAYKGGKYSAYVLTDFGPGALLIGTSQQQALLKEVMTEKYLSLIGQIEPFNDARRENNAQLIGIPKKKADAPSIPQRYLLPQSEVNTNPNTPQPIPGLYEPTPANR